MMTGIQPGELTAMGLWIAVWQEERGSQYPVSKMHEPVPCWLCPWYSMPRLEEMGVGNTQRAIVLVGMKAEQAPAVLSQEAQG